MKKTILFFILCLTMPLMEQNVQVVDTAVVLKKLLPDTIAVVEVEKPSRWEINQNVTLVTSPDIDRLVNMYMDSAIESKTVQGYVIQIYYGRLQVAREMKDAFLKLYPDEIVEIEYDTPDYKVFVGQYMDMNTARAALTALKSRSADYSGAFIRPKDIKIYDLK